MAAAAPTDDATATVTVTDTADDWVDQAMKDDVAVAGFLLEIRHSEPKRCHALKLEWTVRQRRSKHVPRQDESDVVKKKKSKAEPPTRASPTTPLSWSGATSASGGGGGGGGYEECSKPPQPIQAARSKVAVTSRVTTTTTSKRPRKKKTLAQLKEEETFLLKERRNLKKELLTLRLNVENERATNESLKRIKLEQMTINVASSSASHEVMRHQPGQMNAVCEFTRLIELGTSQSPCTTNPSYMVQEVQNCQEATFPLPDLNLPFEDHHNSEALHGMS